MTSPRLIHGICTYWRQWLVAEERGWRSVDHKIHCSGDYKNPPPPEEHEGLRKYVKDHLGGDPVSLDLAAFPVIGAAFVMKICKKGSSVRCLSCGPTHVHLLYDSIADDAKLELGRAKQYASLQLKSKPGRIWARDCSVDEIHDPRHAENLFGYILDHARKERAWIWRADLDAVPARVDVQRLMEMCLSKTG